MATTAAAEATKEPASNYGSVDLNDGNGLPPTWRRNAHDFSLIAATIVGHTDGIADAYKTASPNERHQFSWCGLNDPEGLALRRMQGYRFVTDDEWTKNELLWEWEEDEKNPKGPLYCVRFNDRLMARPAARYFAERERRIAADDATSVVNGSLAQHPGAAAARDQEGRALRPTVRQ